MKTDTNVDGADQDLTLSVGRLQVALGMLRAVEPKHLNAQEKTERTAAMKELREVIDRITNRRLRQITGAMVQNAVAIDNATAELELDLAKLQDAIQIVRVIAAGIGAITNLLRLVSPINKSK